MKKVRVPFFWKLHQTRQNCDFAQRSRDRFSREKFEQNKKANTIFARILKYFWWIDWFNPEPLICAGFRHQLGRLLEMLVLETVRFNSLGLEGLLHKCAGKRHI